MITTDNEPARALRALILEAEMWWPDQHTRLDPAFVADKLDAALAAERLDDTRAVQVLVDHQRMSASSCLCGWDRWGASFAEHQWRMLRLAASANPDRESP